MKIGIYKVSLKDDKGSVQLNIVSLSGKKGAKKQVMASEKCPKSAITAIKKIKQKSV
ncbi:hypothetical protein [Chryseobacterium sp. SL1]|uniref:hypothetical protein n=1 Tax=Chryseobacterium sp. SL1 TaxID=2995159 RepID=UPI002273126D|nr:hypothetical protein [Chryseobacterium sp. SL1]MCY1662566.1 hypothetical protein [Chryseobacterium sp. SL1]